MAKHSVPAVDLHPQNFYSNPCENYGGLTAGFHSTRVFDTIVVYKAECCIRILLSLCHG